MHGLYPFDWRMNGKSEHFSLTNGFHIVFKDVSPAGPLPVEAPVIALAWCRIIDRTRKTANDREQLCAAVIKKAVTVRINTMLYK
jgi:hypothetical protein